MKAAEPSSCLVSAEGAVARGVGGRRQSAARGGLGLLGISMTPPDDVHLSIGDLHHVIVKSTQLAGSARHRAVLIAEAGGISAAGAVGAVLVSVDALGGQSGGEVAVSTR